MSCGMAESSERTLNKLLSKLQQADLPKTQPLLDLLVGQNYKKDEIMHIVNNIPKGTVPSMDDNRAKFYMFCVAALLAIMADVF
jgi:hypothetical protein